MVSAVSSATRSPVCAVSVSRAWSRRPCQVVVSGGGQQSVEFGGVEETDDRGGGPFGLDGQGPGDQVGVFGRAQAGVAEQGVERGQPIVACGGVRQISMRQQAATQNCTASPWYNDSFISLAYIGIELPGV